MAPKRKGDDSGNSEESSARERKKLKTAIARTIAVQPVADPAATGTTNAIASSSKSVRFDSMHGLPSSLDVEKFAEARSFEINAMHEAMKNASSNTTQRAWQQLPRHLRRRAASHDVRRVPLRLRDKARAEMDPMRRKALGRQKPKPGKKFRSIHRTQLLLRRQRDKTWLETHLWHAKRMKMENMWGYRLAVHPTEKSFRPSHRASVHGSILHDASYYALLELKGPEDILRVILDSCCDHQGPSAGAKRYSTGTRVCETHIYKHRAYPFDLIAPITIIWQAAKPWPNTPAVLPTQLTTKSTPAKEGKHKRKGKSRANATATTASSSDLTRIVWLRVHPTALEDVHLALQTAASFALEAARNVNPGTKAEVEIADLREHVNVFEIMGPKASQVIKGALVPTPNKEREWPEFRQFWNSLNRLQTSGSTPRGMIVGFAVHDPRLSFPPKNAKLEIDGGSHLTSQTTVFPSSRLADTDIWKEPIREQLRKPRYKKQDLDKRRSQNLVPGTPLRPQFNDARIPVMLIQRSVEGGTCLAQSPQQPSDSPALHGWTLIIPSGWAMPFFSSLTHTGTRVGGQRERQTQAFEAGCTYFPRDYPSTAAYDMYSEDRADAENDRWERKPPAKRTNFEKIGTRSPWKPDWDVVLGIAQPTPDFVPAQREPGSVEGAAGQSKEVRAWSFRGADVPAIVEELSSMFNPAAGLLDCINKLRVKRKQDPLGPTVRADELWKGALVPVRVLLCGRGAPEDLAVIYSISDDEAGQWMKAEATRKQGAISLEEGEDETELSQLVPSQDDIIGYVTTGHYSLSRGEGHAVGAIPIAKLFELKKQAVKLGAGAMFLRVKVRNRDQIVCRAARLEVLAE